MGTWDMCQMMYYFQYVLGFENKTNKKAVMGTVFHRAMQVLGDKKVAQKKGETFLENDDLPDMTFKQCDDLEYVMRECFEYYKKHEEDVGLTEAEYKTCLGWFRKALAFKGGMLDPRNQDVDSTEEFFDLEIDREWASYDFEVDGKKFEGKLGIKGTIDLIIRENDAYFQVLDYKTGKRLNWATGKEKTYEDLCSDKQLMLYYYALKRLYPERDFYVSIYYVNDGGLFDIVFGPEDFEKAEKMFERRFREVQRTTKPKCISRDCSHWKCQKLCKFSEPVDGRFGSSPEDADKPVCQYFREMIDEKGIDYVTNEYANVSKIGAYGAGGGRLAEDTAKNDGKPSI